jgi:molecular chaperone GrpE
MNSKKESPLQQGMKQAKAKQVNPVALEQQVIDLTEALQRERADAMNVRRRAEEDRLRMASFFKAKTVQELLPALDNLERALKHAPASQDTTATKQHDDWIKGIIGVHKQLIDALQKLGVEKIPTVGEVFNPQYHEAITMEEGEGSVETVIEELQAGFKVGDEVIRHAMVKVALR